MGGVLEAASHKTLGDSHAWDIRVANNIALAGGQLHTITLAQ